MQLDLIRIRNFKGLQECELSPTKFGCLVGENNAGKSSVLQAMAAALNRSGQISTELYYDPQLPVEFDLVFSGIDEAHQARLAEEHRAKIAPIISDGNLELLVRFPVGEKCETLVYRQEPTEARFREDAIKQLLSGKRPPNVANTVREELPELAEGLPDNANIGVAKLHIAEKIQELPADQMQKVAANLPTGIPSSIGQLLPEPIYIPAVKNLTDDLKTAQSTPFGRLLGLLLEEMEPALEQVRASLAQLDAMLNRVTEGDQIVDNRHDKVIALERLIERYLQNNFPRVSVELNVPPPELRAILNTAEIRIDDGSKDTVENKGDGLKRSLTFALLQAYVEQRDAVRAAQAPQVEDQEAEEVAGRPMIFLFEEPELFLHPHSQRVLFKTLAKISEENQVVLTTHSPIFFAPGVTANFVRVAKADSEPKPVTKLYPVNFHLDVSKAETFRLAKFDHADAAFFSKRIVLFEGESDDAFCKHVSQTLNPDWDFEKQGIALVRVSGKGNFAKFRAFFEAFGLDVKIVADLDALFDGYNHLGAPAELTEVRAQAIEAVDAVIAANSIPAEPATRQIKDKVHGHSWKQRYGRAKIILREIQSGREINDADLETLDKLFTWEQDIARVKACRENDSAREAILPVLDGLRNHGICVLGRGAIEEYYPQDAAFGPKPQRALAAIDLIESADDVRACCEPLAEGRECELEEIFGAIFQD
ncbi:ATP-dependent endonuclease [Qipengyuania flava]|uniref:AAA family ATPase n=1 Tax=Qipengyuania flava TaxID=192812 RepID=UPI001ADD23B9|nr:AAA family ATPase [Qipengyuania flava]MBO9505186.1 ATP-dependent endonuclease [Qipengyuania flava]